MDDGLALKYMRRLGLSLYEARIYLGLLQNAPQNGNELSKSTGVPSSKVYAALDKLAAEGIVNSIQRGATTEYVCIPPGDLIRRLEREYVEPLRYLERELPQLAAFPPTAEVLTIRGIDGIRENARAISDRAKAEVYLSIWEDELPHLGDALLQADQRGARIFGMVYGASEPPEVGSWTKHAYEDIVANRIAGHMLTLVVDAQEALIAHVPRQGQPSAVRTRNPVLCLIAREYLHHDIVLQRAQNAIGLERWDERWKADPDLRSLILGRPLASSEEPTGSREEAGS